MGKTKRACHLHPILCTWDVVITCTPVTAFFPLGVQLCSKEKIICTPACTTIDKKITLLMKGHPHEVGHTASWSCVGNNHRAISFELKYLYIPHINQPAYFMERNIEYIYISRTTQCTNTGQVATSM